MPRGEKRTWWDPSFVLLFASADDLGGFCARLREQAVRIEPASALSERTAGRVVLALDADRADPELIAHAVDDAMADGRSNGRIHVGWIDLEFGAESLEGQRHASICLSPATRSLGRALAGSPRFLDRLRSLVLASGCRAAWIDNGDGRMEPFFP
jgi:hypothetical protein